MYMFTCNKCGQTKDLGEFRKTGSKRGHSLDCRECFSAYMREYYKNHPEKYEAHKGYVKVNDRNYKQQWYQYGLDATAFQEMWDKHNGLCWSCKESPVNVVDHDHSCCPRQKSCGKCVRGLLCNGCNTALGHLRDSSERILKLNDYLQTSQHLTTVTESGRLGATEQDRLR